MKSKRKKDSKPRRSRLLRDLQWGAKWGFWFACFYAVIAVGIYIVSGGVTFNRQGVSLGATISLYFGGGLAAGSVVGLLRPLTRSRLGAMLVGSIAAVPIAVGGLMLVAGPVTSWEREIWMTMPILAIGFGVVGALAWWE